MKQAWTDLKSFVTIAMTLTIIALVIIVAIKGNWEIFQIVFALFNALSVSVFTYFFTKKKEDKDEDKIEKGDE